MIINELRIAVRNKRIIPVGEFCLGQGDGSQVSQNFGTLENRPPVP